MNQIELSKAVFEGLISPEDFLKEIWALSKGVQRKGIIYEPGFDLYRTRTFTTAVRPKTISELSYPPVAKSKLQRANREGQQIFYASAGFPTTLAESRALEGQYLIASKWKGQESLVLQAVGVSEDDNVDELANLFRDIYTHPDPALYPFSSQVAQHLMSGEALAGMLYPSISNQNQSHNVALKKSWVDAHLQFTYAGLYYIKAVDGTNYEVDEIDFATSPDGISLDWKGRKRNWVIIEAGGSLKMVFNGGEWEAYKLDGTWVDPE